MDIILALLHAVIGRPLCCIALLVTDYSLSILDLFPGLSTSRILSLWCFRLHGSIT